MRTKLLINLPCENKNVNKFTLREKNMLINLPCENTKMQRFTKMQNMKGLHFGEAVTLVCSQLWKIIFLSIFIQHMDIFAWSFLNSPKIGKLTFEKGLCQENGRKILSI